LLARDPHSCGGLAVDEQSFPSTHGRAADRDVPARPARVVRRRQPRRPGYI